MITKYESLVSVGAILALVLGIIGGIVSSILGSAIGFVGYILIYVGIGKIIEKVKAGYYPSVQQQLIQQIGQGILKSNGNAYITLLSQVQGTITSVTLNNQSAISITPQTLNIGKNDIIVNFDGIVNSLVAGYTYTITLTISVGNNIITAYANVIYQP